MQRTKLCTGLCVYTGLDKETSHNLRMTRKAVKVTVQF